VSPYYPTIEEDLQRAKEILERGKAEPPDQHETQHASTGGTIYGGDIYAAFKLLESFVAEIERLQGEVLVLGEWKEAVIDATVVDWIFTKAHERDPRKAVNDLLAWQQQIALDPAVSKEAHELHGQIKDLKEAISTERIDHNGECLDCDTQGGHRADCPWLERLRSTRRAADR
jgi:hypothetical protein